MWNFKSSLLSDLMELKESEKLGGFFVTLSITLDKMNWKKTKENKENKFQTLIKLKHYIFLWKDCK